MVRFIQAFKVKTQDSVDFSGEIKFSCIVDQQTIIIGRLGSCIEEYQLQKTDQIFKRSSVFHSVGDLTSMLYSTTGKYLATVESDLKILPTVRVYINWRTICDQNECLRQIRVRVANKVTPTINSSDKEDFEMIELPLPDSEKFPVTIACCQMTGNIAIAVNDRKIVLYKFFYNLKSDKLVYVDFIIMDIFITIDYIPLELKISENIILLKSSHSLNAFKIVDEVDGATDLNSDSGLNGKQKNFFDIFQIKFLSNILIFNLAAKLPFFI